VATSSCQNEVALNRIRAGVGCDGPLRAKARNHPGTRGRKPAAPDPRFAAYPGCLRALPQLLQDGGARPQISPRKRNDRQRPGDFGSIRGLHRWTAKEPPTLAHPVSLWGVLDPALLPGVPLIETTWVPRDDRTA
jgi:hypothetical protein